MDDQIVFENRGAFREWLTENAESNKGIWLIFGKAGKLKTLTANESLEEALCFGWIDGQMKSIDDSSYIKKFTPRRKKSKWSDRNKKIVDKLITTDKMTELGLAAIERAKKDGTWNVPKPPPITAAQIEILTKALEGHEPARTNFLNMSSSIRRTYTGHYLGAKKEETRVRRLNKIIERLNENLKPM